MADSNKKDSRDRTKPDAADAGASENEQRRFRGQPTSAPTAADGRRAEIGGDETSEDAPMDAEDAQFLKSK